MKNSLLKKIVGLTFSCLLFLTACVHDEDTEEHEHKMAGGFGSDFSLSTGHQHYDSISCENCNEVLDLSEINTLNLKVYSHHDIDSVKLEAYLFMPQHGHSSDESLTVQQVEEVADEFVVKNVKATMAGTWELQLLLTEGDVHEYMKVELEFR